MMKHEILTGALLAVTALAYGQNLNPTVEVTNAYEGGAEAIKKPLQVMQVPDSVTRFNLDFDYEVFDNPYRGAYEFRPYQVQLRPQPAASGERKFYLRAGAGYRLRPELELVYTPLRRTWKSISRRPIVLSSTGTVPSGRISPERMSACFEETFLILSAMPAWT